MQVWLFCRDWAKVVQLKRSKDLTPEGGGTTPEGSLTLVSNLLLVVANIGLDILGNLLNLILLNTELKYIELNKLVNLSIKRT